jgi:serine/threonine protein kinase
MKPPGWDRAGCSTNSVAAAWGWCLAERVDGGFTQRVVVTLIKRGMDSDAILRRFLRERQILAGLEHVNVARLLDGGVTADGQPYFAMEYVDGQPLTAYCDEHRLAVEQRLRLFEDACRAVQHAHGKLVVHRDLKPSNMLVTGDGQLKLPDSGIAKPSPPRHWQRSRWTSGGAHLSTNTARISSTLAEDNKS